MHPPQTLPDDDVEGRARFIRLTVALTVLALLLRLLYLWAAQVDYPIRGDVLGYWNYAWNLVNHATFSQSPANSAQIIPDSYRGPGYPLFLAMCMVFAGTPVQALHMAQIAQIFVGSALVPLTVMLARSWLERPAALVAGAMVAMWPHLVVFASTLLSETFFGFTLLVMVLATSVAQRRNSFRLGVVAGLVSGLVYLTNPVVLLFPVAIAGLLALRKQTRVGLGLLLGLSLLVGGWSARNATLPESASTGQRALINLVQGSWPLLHAALNDQSTNEIARSVANQINDEEQTMLRDPNAGLHLMWDRFAEQPGYYLQWYFLEKPYLLWDWRVRVGWGDVYFLETHNSPFERNAVLRAMHAVFQGINPLVFVLAALGALVYLVRGVRDPNSPFVPLMSALFFFYITAIHALLQAEPRYSVAYRPFEVLLAVSMSAIALHQAMAFARRRRRPHD
jgi:hypothetical protein